MQILESRLGRPLDEYLRERYERDGWTTSAIARELGIESSTVSRWMAHLGIEARLFGPRKVAVG